MNIIAIIQARMSSTRLPGKVLKPLRSDLLVLDSVVQRINKSQKINKVIVATSTKASDDPIVKYCIRKKYLVERGSLEDVLGRYYTVAEKYSADLIVRVTADCPLVDAELNDRLIDFSLRNDLDYGGICRESIAMGLSTEVLTYEALKEAHQQADGDHREHVTTYLYHNPEIFNCKRMHAPKRYKKTADSNFALDTLEDYIRIKKIFNQVKKEQISIYDINTYMLTRPNEENA